MFKNSTGNRERRKLIAVRAASLMAVLVLFGTSCGGAGKKNQEDAIGRDDLKEEFMEAADTTAVFLNEEKQALIAAYHSRLKVARDQIRDYNARDEVMDNAK
jgi:hypothetical protein